MRELFYVPKYGKVTDKARFGRLSVYITVIVLCMAGMAFTAYAYFSASVLSGSNSIQAAHFDVQISILEFDGASDAKAQGSSVEVIRDGANEYRATLVAGKEYLVTVNATGTASTGFVLITAENTQYFTQQLFRDTASALAFTLVPAKNMEVAFMPHFGTSSRYEDFINNVEDPYYVTQGDKVALTVLSEPVVDLIGEGPEATEGTQDPNNDTTSPTQTTAKYYHEIKNGENLYAIAKQYQVDMNDLMELNGITDADMIVAGDLLLLPEGAIIPPDMTTPETGDVTEPEETTEPTDNTDSTAP